MTPPSGAPTATALASHLLSPYRSSCAAIAVALAAGAALALVPLLAVRVVVGAIPRADFATVVWAMIATLAASIAGSLLSVWEARATAKIGHAVTRDARVMLLDHVLRFPMQYFTTHKTGEVVNRVSHDADAFAGFFSGTLVSLAGNVCTVALFLVTATLIDWRFTVVAVVALVLMPLVVAPLVGRSYRSQLGLSQAVDNLMSIARETLSFEGIVLMRAHSAERRERDRYADANAALTKARLRFVVGAQLTGSVLMATMALGPALLWLAGSYLILSGTVQTGDVLVAAMLLARLYGPVSGLASAPGEIASAAAILERMRNLLGLPVERTGGETVALSGGVEFEDVSFVHEDGRVALTGVSFAVPPGGCLGIVGASGAGKSTIVNLVLGLVTASSGTVRFDRRNADELSVASLREQIAVVTQETMLFHDSLAENLRYARLGASDAELERVLAAVGLGEWLRRLPDGLATTVGARGFAVSGGERQRIALARALLKQPTILVLDEPTSALDAASEAEIEVALANLLPGVTRIVVSHRLSLLRDAVEIIVLSEGRIAERGTHDDLLAKHGLYSSLSQRQFQTADMLVPVV